MRSVISREPRHTQIRRAASAALSRSYPRPLVGLLLCLLAVATVALDWAVTQPPSASGGSLALLLALIVAVAVSRWVPLRVGRATHLYLASVPLYLLCCLFVPPVAAVATGLGMLTRETSICRRCRNTLGDIAAQVGRWMLLSLAVSTVVHLWPSTYLVYTGLLAGFLLWLGDVATAPFVISPMTGKSPRLLWPNLVRQSYAGELMQYLLGLLTLMLLQTHLDLTILVIYLPLILVSLALLYLYLKSVDDLAHAAPESRQVPQQ